MSAGTIIRVLVGKQRNRLAEVIAVTSRAVTVRGSFGVLTFGLREVEAV